MAPLRICNMCGIKAYTREDLDTFKKESSCKYGRSPRCKECSNNKKRTYQQTSEGKEYHRNASYMRNFGITLKEYDNMYGFQKGRCAICGTDKVGNIRNKHFHVDHCHSSGEVRGLLCDGCNKGLGSFKDNIDALINAAEYLNKGRRR